MLPGIMPLSVGAADKPIARLIAKPATSPRVAPGAHCPTIPARSMRTARIAARRSLGGAPPRVVPRVVLTAMWGMLGDDTLSKLKRWNYGVQRIRCRIEKIFGTWKRSYGLQRMRWRGIAKAALQVRLTAVAYNLRRFLTLLSFQSA